jgi:polyisoprenoid-binding protein YceI
VSGLAGVLTTADGWPVAGGTVTVVDGLGAQVARAVSGEDGSFTVDGPAAEPVTVIVAAAGHEPVARTVTVGAAAVTPLGVVELRREGGGVLPPTGSWVIDPSHSSIHATAINMGAARVHGRLRRFSGTVVVASPLEHSSVEVTIDAGSVDSADDARDGHLRSADFLDVLRFPEIRYKSEGLRRIDPTHWVVDGVLTLKDVSAPVPLEVTYLGTGPDAAGNTRATFTATAEVVRDRFAMSWNQSVLAGLLAVGRTLRIEIDIAAVRS